MGLAGRLVFALILPGLAVGCGNSPPPPARPRPLAAPLAEDRDLAPCPGGLLCEDPQPLGGFRVPLGCVRGYDGGYTKTCTVRGLRPVASLVEFLASRYAAQRQGDSWWIDQAGVGAMRVQLRGETAEFIAMPAAITPSGSER